MRYCWGQSNIFFITCLPISMYSLILVGMLCRALYSPKASPTNSFEAWDQDRDQVGMEKHQKTHNLKPQIYFRAVNKKMDRKQTLKIKRKCWLTQVRSKIEYRKTQQNKKKIIAVYTSNERKFYGKFNIIRNLLAVFPTSQQETLSLPIKPKCEYPWIGW